MSKSIRDILDSEESIITFNKAFDQYIKRCKAIGNAPCTGERAGEKEKRQAWLLQAEFAEEIQSEINQELN